jgi:hypothetical protein
LGDLSTLDPSTALDALPLGLDLGAATGGLPGGLPLDTSGVHANHAVTHLGPSDGPSSAAHQGQVASCGSSRSLELLVISIAGGAEADHAVAAYADAGQPLGVD